MRWNPRVTIGFLLLFGFVSCTQKQSVPAASDVRHDATVRAIEEAMPSVVNIAALTVKKAGAENPFDLFRQLYEPQEPREQRSVGSGVIIEETGYVLTSLHVVERATRVQVKLWDGREFECDPIVGTPYNDVALLRIHANPGDRFKPIKLAADDDLLLGETVIALGSPFGLGGTVTSGILSSKPRRISTGNETLGIKDWLQTDAAINEGNSGGPLINLNGELIGLNADFVPQAQGIGFAIPVRQVREAISRFFSPEVRNALWFGARVKANDGPLRVDFVQTNSPAFNGGLRMGDEIAQVNNWAPTNAIQFNYALCGTNYNQSVTVTLTAMRNGNHRAISARLIPFDELFRQKLGLMFIRTQRGLVIDSAEPDGPAAKAGLQDGWLMTGIDGQPTPDVLAAASILSAKKPGDVATLSVLIERTAPNMVQTQQVQVNVATR